MKPTPRGRHNLNVTSSGIYTQLRYTTADNDPINLTGYSAVLYAKYAPSSTGHIFKLTDNINMDGSGVDMSQSSVGIINLMVSPVTSSMLPQNKKTYYSLDVYSGSYYIGLLEGKIIS